MRRLLLWGCGFLLAAGVAATQNLQLSNTTVSSGAVAYQETNSITAAGYVVSGSANVSFTAGSQVTLQPGFQALAGSTFAARIATGGYLGTVATPAASPGGGTYSGAQTVTLTTTTTGATIRYTLDGSLPSESSGTSCSSPCSVGVNNSLTLNAIGVETGWGDSAILSAAYTITSLSSFITCVGPQGVGTSCTLAGVTYTVDGPISVSRSNIQISGSTDPNHPTILLRGHDLGCAILELGRDASCNPTTVPLSNVTIQNVTFCGGSVNRQGDPGNPCPTQAETTCEQNGSCAPELYITNTGPGQNWSAPNQAPFLNTGPYNVTIANCKFEDSPSGHNVFIAPNGVGQSVNDVYLSQNVISSGGVQIGEYNSSVNWGDSTQCDDWQPVYGTIFADDPSITLPRDIRFDSNTFWVNAGAVSGRGRYVQVNGNNINGYYWTTGGGGGAIEQDWCADEVKITNNTLNGNWRSGSTGPSGMELYSRNLTVSGNTVTGYAPEGIGIFSVSNATVTGNHLWGNDLGHPADPVTYPLDAPEVKVATRFPWWSGNSCHPANPGLGIGAKSCDYYRDTSTVSVQQNDNGNQSSDNVQNGIFFDACCDGSTDNVVGDSVSGGGLHAKGAQVACDPHVSANTCPASHQTGLSPHTIAAFPEGTAPLGAPLGSGDPSLRQPPPPNERYFRFGANDPGGSGNFNGLYCANPPGCISYAYASMLGVFDAVVDPGNQANFGLNGPYATQAACLFDYLPVSNTIYLDAPSANFTWTGGSSVVGNGGSILDNGICAINTGNSTVVVGQQYIEIVLDIAFHRMGTWYMYEVAVNGQGQYSISNQVANVWSLWGYWPVTSAQ